jgi:hypothetical protein
VNSAPGHQPGQFAPARTGRGKVLAGDGRLVTGSAYVMLFLLGALQGVVGCFHYASGPVPLAALAFDGLILVTSLLGASGMRNPSGGLMPVLGWFLAVFVLAMGTQGGSVVITNTTAGKWFLFGGSASAAAGAIAGFARWSRSGPARRAGLARRKTDR